MYRAEIEPMPENPPDRFLIPDYGKLRFMRVTDLSELTKNEIAYPEAKRLAKDLNGRLNIKRAERGA